MSTELNNRKVMIGLSGGINSMAVLCWLVRTGVQPSELHLFYAHFKEHSDDTFPFVRDGIRFARKHFANVQVKVTRNSVIEFFRANNMIPHPTNGACSKHLKILPMESYGVEHGVEHDLIGYVKKELKRRSTAQVALAHTHLFSAQKGYPIGAFTDDWCITIVDEMIGWHPAIYDIKAPDGTRLFKHNNCLPRKNMYPKDIALVREHYPQHFGAAMQLSAHLKRYWGRNEAEFYSTFGRDLGQEITCTACTW